MSRAVLAAFVIVAGLPAWASPVLKPPDDSAAKLLLAWPGLDRCATVGFRCVADAD